MGATFMKRRDEIPWKKLGDDRGMLLELETGNYFELGGVAVQVWGALDGRWSVEEIARAITTELQMSFERVLDDLQRFGEELRRHRLVTQVLKGGSSGETDPVLEIMRGVTAYVPPVLRKKGNLKYLSQPY